MAADPSPEFQDWELLANSDSDAVMSPNSNTNPRNIEEIEADSGGVLRLDYFSLENDNRFANPVSEEGSVESDNPSWIDPGYETRYPNRVSWSDSGSDRSRDFDVRNELAVVDSGKNEIDLLGVGVGEGFLDSCEGKRELGFEDFGGNQSADKGLSELWSGSGGDVLVFSDAEKMNEESVIMSDSKNGENSEQVNSSALTVAESKGGCGEEKRKVVWWKVPFELLKYCVFRISPVWTFSMAAAVMGFVILGRRLYKMKRKPRSLPLKVTVDDKKVSQFMSRAARLNEAFSVVRRVPIVRPLLPAAASSGVNTWPVMTLR